MLFLGLSFGFVVANFGYQAFGAHDWSLAIDRSWFQVCAIGAVWIAQSLNPQISG